MRKIGTWVVFSLFVLTGSAKASVGTLGINYSVGPNFILGSSDARDAGIVEPGIGAGLQYGILPNMDLTMSYDYIHSDLHTQALTFGGLLRLPSYQTCIPLVGAGIGFGKPFSGEGWGHLSLKLTGGLEKMLTDTVSVSGILSYQFVDGSDPIGSVHAFEPGLRMTYYFGNVTPPTLRSRR